MKLLTKTIRKVFNRKFLQIIMCKNFLKNSYVTDSVLCLEVNARASVWNLHPAALVKCQQVATLWWGGFGSPPAHRLSLKISGFPLTLDKKDARLTKGKRLAWTIQVLQLVLAFLWVHTSWFENSKTIFNEEHERKYTHTHTHYKYIYIYIYI